VIEEENGKDPSLLECGTKAAHLNAGRKALGPERKGREKKQINAWEGIKESGSKRKDVWGRSAGAQWDPF